MSWCLLLTSINHGYNFFMSWEFKQGPYFTFRGVPSTRLGILVGGY